MNWARKLILAFSILAPITDIAIYQTWGVFASVEYYAEFWYGFNLITFLILVPLILGLLIVIIIKAFKSKYDGIYALDIFLLVSNVIFLLFILRELLQF